MKTYLFAEMLEQNLCNLKRLFIMNHSFIASKRKHLLTTLCVGLYILIIILKLFQYQSDGHWVIHRVFEHISDFKF
jgi:hypothetical protein